MPRVCLLLACLVVPVQSAPLPKAREAAAPYLMTKVGDTKVSECRGPEAVLEVTEVVTKVEQKDGTVRVTSRVQLNGGDGSESTLEASATGVFLVAHQDKDLADPRPYLRLPAKIGHTWTWNTEEPGFAPAKHTRTVAELEEVEVPAGKFLALRIESKLESPRVPTLTGTYWFAPGVGEVKSVLKTSTGVQSTVLKSFTPGK